MYQFLFFIIFAVVYLIAIGQFKSVFNATVATVKRIKAYFTKDKTDESNS